MTWGVLLRALLTDPLAWAFALSVGTATGLGGCVYGEHLAKSAQELHFANAANVQLKIVAKEEHAAAININEVDKAYVEKKTTIAANTAAVSAEFDGLRVKPMCHDSPAIAARASRNNDAGTAERIGTGEVDFAGIESEVIQLGHDYDAAAAKINSLQALIAIYQKACAADSP